MYVGGHLVAIDEVVPVGIEIRVGKLPGFVGIVGYSNLEIVQIDRLV